VFYRNQAQRIAALGSGKYLFDFRFFVDNMSTDERIEFFDLHLFRHGFFILSGRIKMASAFGRYQFNFITHGVNLLKLGFYTAFTHIRQHGVYAFFINNTHGLGRNSKANPTIFTFYPKSVLLQIRQKTSFGSIVCV
jgi:hypothetical protein